MTRQSLFAAASFIFLAGGAAAAAPAVLDLVEPIADYKIYVSEKLDQLVEDTTAFTTAVKTGDVE